MVETITVEERAKKAFDAFMKVHYMELSDEMVMNAITQALRDQIEDCAKILDREAATYAKGAQPEDRDFYPSEWREVHNSAKRIAQEIRALAEPEEEKEKGE